MIAVKWLYIVFGLALANWLLGMIAVRSFLASTRAIATTIDLQNFAALARQNMIQALLQMALLIGGMLLGIYCLIRGQAELILILVLNGLIWSAGTIGKPLEERARSLKVLDPLLEERYQAICRTWVGKPFPDF